MPTMIRKQIYIRRDQDRKLKRFGREEGRTEAELVRQALDEFAKSRASRAAWKQEKKFIEEWMRDAIGRAPSADRGWRREDIYDRKVSSRQ